MNAGSPSAKAASVIRTLEPVVANMTDLGLLDKSYIYGFDEMKIQYNKSVCKASDHTPTTHLGWLASAALLGSARHWLLWRAFSHPALC